VASKFMRKLGRGARVWKFEVPGSAIFGHFNERQEDEFVVDPTALTVTKLPMKSLP
jgi:hypothetical protein